MNQSNLKHAESEIALRLPFGWMVAVTLLDITAYYTEGVFEILMHDETGRYLKREVRTQATDVPRLTLMLREQGDEMILKLFNHEGSTQN
jgi:hypothetical protein